MTIKWKCEASGCYVEKQLPDWAMLDGCFGNTRVTPSDIDGCAHQNGSVLFLEKKFPDGRVSQPQWRMIQTLVRQGNSFIIFWCEEHDGSDISFMTVLGIDGYDPNDRVQATLEDLRAAVCKWWETHYERGKM